MHVHNQDGFTGVSRFRKRIQISEIQSGVPVGEAEVWARIMMRHGINPLLVDLHCPACLERGGTGSGDGMILITGTTADTNRPYYLVFPLERDASSKNHDFSVV